VRRLAFVLVLTLALAACGSSHKKSSSGPSGPSAQAQIRSAYVKFFAGKTSLSDRVALLQNGSQFRPVIKAFANNPLAKNVSATVSSVALQGRNKAKVVYQVKFAGTSLPKQTGTAVRQDGTWKVGFASLCKLVSLGGTTPSACKS
jgi:hypothetical protein